MKYTKRRLNDSTARPWLVEPGVPRVVKARQQQRRAEVWLGAEAQARVFLREKRC